MSIGLLQCKTYVIHTSTNAETLVKIGAVLSEIFLRECSNFSHFKARNAWQSLAYSPLDAIVSPLANTNETHSLTY